MNPFLFHSESSRVAFSLRSETIRKAVLHVKEIVTAYCVDRGGNNGGLMRFRCWHAIASRAADHRQLTLLHRLELVHSAAVIRLRHIHVAFRVEREAVTVREVAELMAGAAEARE